MKKKLTKEQLAVKILKKQVYEVINTNTYCPDPDCGVEIGLIDETVHEKECLFGEYIQRFPNG